MIVQIGLKLDLVVVRRVFLQLLYDILNYQLLMLRVKKMKEKLQVVPLTIFWNSFGWKLRLQKEFACERAVYKNGYMQ